MHPSQWLKDGNRTPSGSNEIPPVIAAASNDEGGGGDDSTQGPGGGDSGGGASGGGGNIRCSGSLIPKFSKLHSSVVTKTSLHRLFLF